MTRRSALLPLLLCTACADPLLPPENDEEAPADAPLQLGTPPPAPCQLSPADPTTLVVTTTDFATGAVTIVEPDGTVRTDVAVGSPDAIPYPAPGGVAIVHRFGYDFVDLLNPGTWRSLGQHALEADDADSPNPHAIAFDDDGLGFVTLFGSATLVVLDLAASPGDAVTDRIDLSPFADDDGRPEASLTVRCGDTLWVGVERLDVPGGYRRVDEDVMVAIDLETRVPWDFDGDTPGGQGLPLLGAWLRQLREHPSEPSVVLGLTSGIERIDLGALQSDWLVTPEAFAAAGIGSHLQPLSFDIDETGERAWVAAYLPAEPTDCDADPSDCFDHAQLFEVDLTMTNPVLEPFGEPFQAVERTVVRVEDTLWVGSRQTEAPGLYTYDLTTHPPTLTSGPLSTGLPPYSITAVP